MSEIKLDTFPDPPKSSELTGIVKSPKTLADSRQNTETTLIGTSSNGFLPKIHQVDPFADDKELDAIHTSGWQLSLQSGAVVSALLAGIAAQLLSFFKADLANNPNVSNTAGSTQLVLSTCYAAVFFNIGATIQSFILTRRMSYVEFDEYRLSKGSQARRIKVDAGRYIDRQTDWLWILYLIPWFINFALGIFTLLFSVISYVFIVELFAVRAVTLSIFIWIAAPCAASIVFVLFEACVLRVGFE